MTKALSPTQEQGRGTTIMILGVLSLIAFGLILGITAWVMGSRDLKKIKAGTMPENERKTTTAGMVLGIIGTFAHPPVTILILVMVFGLTL